MNSSQNTDFTRVKKALATLRRKIDEVLGFSPDLMEINDLGELPKEKADALEYRLWRIFSYGEYYVKAVMGNLPPMFSLANEGKATLEEYRIVIDKMRSLADTTKAPSRHAIEKQIVGKMEGFYDESGEINQEFDRLISHSDIDKHMDYYEKLASSGWVRDRIMECIELRKIVENHSSVAHGVRLPGAKNDIIKNSFALAVEAAIKHLEQLDDDDSHYWDMSFEHCQQIIKKRYFNPDAWAANEAELHSIFVERKVESIVAHVRGRLCEIYVSYVFGNYMSAIALSRCLLEYALKDSKSLLEARLMKQGESLEHEIEERVSKSYKWTDSRIRIGHRVEMAARAFPELKAGMEKIRCYGNGIMHPEKKVFPLAKIQAKKCFDAVSDVIGTLYSESA